MKKFLLALIFLPSMALATDTNNMTVTGRVITQRMDVSTMGKVVQIGFIDGSTQTTAGYVRFKDEGTFFMNGSTIDCVGAAITCTDQGNGVTRINVTASGGGGGGGGSGFVFDGSANTAVSTASYPGATITSDGQGFSTITYIPAILSTYTALTSTAVTASKYYDVTNATITAIRQSTATFETRFNLFSSTTQAFTESANSTMTAIRQSTATFETRFNTFASTVTGQDETFKGWFSTNSSVNDVQNSTIQAIVRSTTSLEIKMATATLIYNTGIALTAFVQGTNITLTQSGSSLTIAASASGGGGGGSSGGFLYTGGANVAFSTISFPLATITSDGQGGSTISYVTHFATISAQMNSLISTVTFVGISTQNIQSNFSAQNSTADAAFDAIRSSMVVIRQSTSTFENRFNSFSSTENAQAETFKGWFATNAVLNDVQNSTLTIIRQSTGTFETRFNLFSSTTQAFTESANSTMTAIRTSTSTFDARFNTFASTNSAELGTFKLWFSTNSSVNDVQNSTIQAIVRSTTSLEIRMSTATLIYNAGIALTALVQGSNITLTQSGSSLTIAGSAGGGSTAEDAPKVGVFDGSVNTKSSSFTVLTPFGAASNAGDTQMSTMTVMGSTNPYRTISIPAGSWIGCGQSSASKVNGGFALTSTATAYNAFGELYHLFDAPNTTTSFVCSTFRMPFEWAGDSVSFQVVWHSTGLSGITVNKLMAWSLGGVAISSGSSIYTAVTSSVTTFSAFASTNTDLYTNQSAAYNIVGTPLPGGRVKFVLNAGGAGFTGIPRMTEVLLYYRQSIWDGRLR